MPATFSALQRQHIIQQMRNQIFDVLVIGGGITGAGIALDATARGLKVALVDMQDFAGGTSGRSTKLIHGGLRYLKQLELKLVAEVGKEREIIHRNAPQLTKPEPMLLPLVRGGSLNKFTASLGMFIYERLAGVKKHERFKLLDAAESRMQEPLLDKDDLLGSVLFYEYRTDDARLAVEVLKEAVQRGAQAINYVKATAFNYDKGKICGAQLQDQFNNNTFSINATYVVNAAGPWVDELDAIDNTTHGNKLKLTKGIHLVVDAKTLPVKQSLYFDTFDKRMIFIIPRDGKTYIGTTDTFYSGDKLHPSITLQDKEYLIKCVNAFFPKHNIGLSDIESAWAGLRPLIGKPGKKPSEISRKDELFEWESGLITIAGGKLTGYRKMAQRVVNVLAKRIHVQQQRRLPPCSTQHISLAGNITPEQFAGFVKQKTAQGITIGLTATEAGQLANRYCAQADQLFNYINDIKSQSSQPLPLALHAQLLYAIHSELCATPADFFIRRTGALYFDAVAVLKYKDAVIAEMQNIFGWSDELFLRFKTELEAAMQVIGNVE